MVLLAIKEERLSSVLKPEHGTWSGEVVVFCPRCKAFETVSIDGSKLLLTRKFTQEGNQIYHDCGSPEPCRLYHSW